MAEAIHDYSVSRFTHAQLGEIEAAWRGMQDGPDMTAFQSYDWALLANERILHERASRLTTRSRYYVVFRDGAPVLIAPLRAHLTPLSPGHRRGIHLVGRNGPADYLNFIYRDLDVSAARIALSAAAADFGTTHVHLERLLGGTQLCRWVSGLPGAQTETQQAIQLVLPDDSDSYSKLLSKSTRQNIRTGWNRAHKDGVGIRIDISSNISVREAAALGELKRRRERTRQTAKGSLVKRALGMVRNAYFAGLFVDYDEAQRAMVHADKPWVLRVFVDDDLAAFAFGLSDNFGRRRTLRLLQVGIDNHFGRYSPGIIGLHNFIQDEVDDTSSGWEVIDFTRGEERYKSQLGGTPHTYSDVSFRCRRQP